MVEDMATIGELAIKEAKENETRKILRLVEKAEKEGRTVKEIIEMIESQLEK